MHERMYDLGPLEDMSDGFPTARTIEGKPVLVYREGDRVSVVGGLCPHAGAPLVEGVLRDGRITCPWHKARFCLRSGALLDPPAVDPLPCYEVQLEGGHVHAASVPHNNPSPPQVSGGQCFIIVGAGAAGAMAAQTLRSEGFAGRIVMIDRENRVPYDRTLLSKYVLSSAAGGEKSPLQTQSYYTDHAIERLTGEVGKIDVNGRCLFLTDGSILGYDVLLLATGGKPQRPPLPGADRRQVFFLRSRADADALLAQAERSQHAVILGCSFIGLEVAASLRERGLSVTVVGREEVPFEHRFGAPVGQALRHLHERQGVTFYLSTEVALIDGEGLDVGSVLLTSGERLPADLVVIGFGVTPETAYASELPRSDDGGILVDSMLQADRGIYVAGDIACFPYLGDGPKIRVEHWRVAEQQGIVAARNMMGRQERYDALPVFWTIHYLKRLDYIGHAETWDDLVLHGDVDKLDFLLYYLKDGIVSAVAGIGRDQDTAAVITLLGQRRQWTAEELGPDPSRYLARPADA